MIRTLTTAAALITALAASAIAAEPPRPVLKSEALITGSIVRVGYDGKNGKPYVPVGRLLIERGELPRDKVTMASIRLWMAENPKKAASLRRQNPSFVFFREIIGEGPIGAQLVPQVSFRRSGRSRFGLA